MHDVIESIVTVLLAPRATLEDNYRILLSFREEKHNNEKRKINK